MLDLLLGQAALPSPPGGTAETIVYLLTATGVGAGLVKLLPMFLDWLKNRGEEKRKDQSSVQERRRAETADAVQHYERLLERVNAEYDEAKALWTKERGQMIREQATLVATNRDLLVRSTAMQDRLAVYQGIGPEGAERMDPVIVIQAEDHGPIRWSNDPAGTFLGYPLVHLLGQPMTRVIPPERHDHFRTEMRRIGERLMALPENLPIRHAIAGQVRRRDGTTIRVCVLINGFRIRNVCSKCGQVDWSPVYRIHLRQRWEESDISLNPPYVPVNSADEASETTSSIAPGADDRDEVAPTGYPNV